MVSTFSAVGFGNVLTSDPAFGVSAFRTLVSPILNVRVALEGRRAPVSSALSISGRPVGRQLGASSLAYATPLLQAGARLVSQPSTPGSEPLSMMVRVYGSVRGQSSVKRRISLARKKNATILRD
jgi:hypothetical protein